MKILDTIRYEYAKKKQSLGHLSFFSLGNLIMTFGGFFSVVILANALSANDYGNYKYVFSIVGTLGALSFTGGFRNTVIQSTAKGMDGIVRYLFKTNLSLSLPMLLGGVAVGCYYFINNNEFLGYAIILATTGSVIGNNGIIAYGYLNGRKLYGQLLTLQSIQSAINVFVLFSITLVTNNVLVIVATSVISTAWILTAFYYYVEKKLLRNKETDTSIITYGKHLNILSVITTVMMNIDSILIFKIIGSQGLALYALATPFVDRIIGFLKGAYFFALPKFTEQGHAGARVHLYTRSLIGLFLGTVVFGVYYVASPILFKIFFPNYLEVINLSRLTALNIPIIAFSILPDAFLDSLAEIKYKYIVKATTTFFRIVLMLLLIFPFGIAGVICSELLARLAGSSMTIILIERYIKRHKIPSVSNPT